MATFQTNNQLVQEENEGCHFDNNEQMQLKGEMKILEHVLVKEECAVEQEDNVHRFSKYKDEFGAWKECYVEVTRFIQPVLEEYLIKKKACQSIDADNQYIKCKLCKKQYLRGQLLKLHLKVHIGVEPTCEFFAVAVTIGTSGNPMNCVI